MRRQACRTCSSCSSSSSQVSWVTTNRVLQKQTHQRKPMSLGVEVFTRYIDVHYPPSASGLLQLRISLSIPPVEACKCGLCPLLISRATVRDLTCSGPYSNALSVSVNVVSTGMTLHSAICSLFVHLCLFSFPCLSLLFAISFLFSFTTLFFFSLALSSLFKALFS